MMKQRPLERALQVITDLEDVYKITFNIIDKTLIHCVGEPGEAKMPLHYATDAAKVWAPPITYRRIVEIAQQLYAQTIVNSTLGLVMLLDSYLKVTCLNAVPVKPFDDTWYHFEHLQALSGVDPAEVAGHKSVKAIMALRDATLGSKMDNTTITHVELLATFVEARKFMVDFEAAFSIANPHVKEIGF